ncbi:hypothetical protein [Fidelibacter multiformis]|uniref:hypothetical protein n=1 Tax=Fidelibacter multiformis TaxID=3377529 RepID=UPI0037DBFD6D
MKKYTVIKYLMLLLLFTGLAYAQSHGLYALMYNIQRVCKAYQIDVGMQDIRVEKDFEDNLVLILKLDARRTNYNSTMMTGFFAVAKAIRMTPNSPEIDKVSLEISVADRQSNVIFSTVALEDLILLENGSITPAEFRKKIESM